MEETCEGRLNPQLRGDLGGPPLQQLKDQTNTRTTMRRLLQQTAGLEPDPEKASILEMHSCCVCVWVCGSDHVTPAQNTGTSVSKAAVHFYG